MKHKLLSILLSLSLVISLLPTVALADEAATYPVEVQNEKELRYALYSAPTDGTQVTIKLTNDITLEMLYAAPNYPTSDVIEDHETGDTFNRYKTGVHPTADNPGQWNPLVTDQTDEQKSLYGAYYHMSVNDERIARLVVKSGQNVVLDLNGHTIEKNDRATHGDWSNTCTDIIGNYGTLTITDTSAGEKGTIRGRGYYSCSGAVLHNYAGATMTVEAVNVDGNAEGMTKGTGQYVISNEGGTITIDGANVYDTTNKVNASLLHNASGTTTVKGNATLNHPNTKTINAKGGEVILECATIISDVHAIYAKGGTTNITGDVTIKASAEGGAAGTLTIDGGAITKAENVSLPAPSGSTWIKVGNTEILVKESSAAVVNGVNYDTLAAAITAANAGDTITLLKDLTLESTVTLNKAVTLTAVSGVTVTAYDADTSFVLSNGAALDGLTIDLGVKAMNQVILMQTNSTVRNCAITGQYQSGDGETSRAIVGQAGATDLTITGNTFKNLRQPAYINSCTGTISDNYVDGTRGWVICGSSNMTITGNTFGENAVDIAIISDNEGSTTNNYAGKTAELSKNNSGAYTQNQIAKAEAEDGVLVVGRTDGYTLDNAFAEAKSGATVKLEADVESSTAITVPAGVTLDGNGKAITCTGTIASGAFVTAGGDDVTIKNVTIDTNKNAKHGVQFYSANGGKLSGVTVNGGSYTSVLINGSTNIVLENSTFNPDDGAYANVELGMGGGVSTIPTVTVHNITGDSDKSLIYVDKATADKIKDAKPGENVNDIIKDSVTNTGSSDITVDAPGGDITIEAPDQGGSSEDTYPVVVEKSVGGRVKAAPTSTVKGSRVTITVTPDEGYFLVSLTATDKKGNELDLTEAADGKYTFKMPSSKVVVKAVFTKDGTSVSGLPFTDVNTGAWYYGAVKYVYENGLMDGTSATTFAPTVTTSRAMVAQVLYNLEGNKAAGTASFTDVAAGSWYADAVNWAASNGLVKGYGNGKFGPEDSVTREQLAVILYNYAKLKGYDVTAKGDLNSFTDGAKVSGWAKDAMTWAVGSGLMQGSNSALNPLGTATRAEVAQMLMNFCTKNP